MNPIVTQYVTYWIDRLGLEHISRVLTNSKDHDTVWAEVSSPGAR